MDAMQFSQIAPTQAWNFTLPLQEVETGGVPNEAFVDKLPALITPQRQIEQLS